jgi:hypothetical protein
VGIVSEFRESGESIARFAARRRLRVSSLKWWCWRLRETSATPRVEARDEVRLVPVGVVGLSARTASPLVISITDVEVRIEVGTDVASVGALVRELRSRC